MKKIILFIFLIFMPLSIYSYSAYKDGVYLDLTTKGEAYVTYISRSASNKDAYSGDIVIPSSFTDRSGKTYPVTRIREYAFFNCENLTSVTIPNSVKSIGEYAFDYCTGLKTVNISNSVEYIGYKAFRYCESLTSITIPSSVKSVGENMFQGCSMLSTIVVEEGNLTYDSRDNCNAIIETSTNTLFSGCKNTIIPNTVTKIGADAFNNCKELKSVSIPESVTYIDNYAFAGCSLLREITCWGETPPTLHDNAFGSMSKSAFTVYVPYRLISTYKADSQWKLFNNYKSIEKELTIEGITYQPVLGSNIAIVTKSSAQKNISIPRTISDANTTFTVTSIGDRAFYNNIELTSVFIPNTIESIGEQAFGGCVNLSQIICECETPPTTNNSFTNYGIATLFVPRDRIIWYRITNEWTEFDNILGIGNEVIIDGISYITYPENHTALILKGTSKEEITLPDHIMVDGVPFTVNSINNRAFYDCKEVTSVYIPNTIETIGKEAFEGCVNLNTITCNRETPPAANSSFYNYKEAKIYVPYNSIQQYENAENWRQFEDFIGIGKEVEIDGIAYIAYSEDGSALVLKGTSKDEITLPDHIMVDGVSYIVNAIHRRAFYDIEGIAKIILPSTITSIGSRALYNMTEVYCHAVIPPTIDYRTFSEETSVYVPIGTKSAYRQAPHWTDHEKLFVMEDHHDFGDVIWEWDESENAVAKLICKNDEEEIFTAEAVVTSTVITPSTCSVKGKKKLMANVTFADLDGTPEYTTEKEVELPLAEHTMTIVNNNDGTHSDVCSACGGNEHRESHSFTDGYCKACGAVSGDADTNVSGLSNVLYANNVTTEPGKEVVIPVSIKSSVPMTGFQFKISAPFVDLSDAIVAYSSAMPNQNVSFRSAIQSDGTIKVLCYSTDGEYLGGTGNNVCTISFLMPEDLQQQGYPITISNIRLTQSGSLYKTDERIKSTISITNHIIGDANNSGEVDESDITAVVNHIYGQTPEDFNNVVADVNGNGVINVSDIAGIVSIINGGSVPHANDGDTPQTKEMTLSAPSITIGVSNEVTLPIYIDNADAVSAFQFDISLPENTQAKNVSCSSDDHLCMGAYMEDGKYRVISYSMTNEKFINSSAPVVYITLSIDSRILPGSYGVNLSSVFTSSNGNEFLTHVVNGKLTLDNATDVNTIDHNYGNVHEATTVSGIKVKTDHKLSNGIYIINGQKRIK